MAVPAVPGGGRHGACPKGFCIGIRTDGNDSSPVPDFLSISHVCYRSFRRIGGYTESPTGP